MKNEAEFNTMIKNSIVSCGGFAHKISDIGQMQHGLLPFDLFGCCNNKMIVCESKYLKEPQSFNFSRLENHQIESLLKVYESFQDKDRIFAVFCIGVNFGRNDIRVFWWANEDLFVINKRKINKENIHKKEFENNAKYCKVVKSKVDFIRMIENAI